MHIPNDFLDPKVSGSMMGAAAVVLAYALAKVRAAVTAIVPQEALAAAGKGVGNLLNGSRRALTRLGERKLYLMGMAASLIFAAQMFNFPINNGTSGHLLGGVLASVLLGPFAGTLVIAAVLAIQSLFFGDGGIMALGANIINMAFFGAFIGYYIYYIIKKYLPEWASIGLAAWASVVLAAFACSLEIGYSGTIGFSAIIPSMFKVHAIIGIVEALITVTMIKVFRSMTAENGEETE